jgi:hypothetical protein
MATVRDAANDGPRPPSGDLVFSREDAAVTRRIAGETVIVPVRGDVVDLDALYTLNETGTFLWDLIDGQRTVGQLAEALIAAFDVTPEVATADVARLIANLRDEGLLRPAHE